MADLKGEISQRIKETHVLVYSKTTCPYCTKVKRLLQLQCVDFTLVEVDEEANGEAMLDVLKELTGQRTVPNVFVNRQHIGGCDQTVQAYSNGTLAQLILEGQGARDVQKAGDHAYQYDLIVIGGGSGGLACSKEAGGLGARVACLDFVKPSPVGTSWGLGGTCVNVGCIPKKLMHQAALLGQALEDARCYGWQLPEDVSHSWSKMVEGIQNHIGSLNWGYRVALRDKEVKYLNALAEFVDPHTIKHVNKRGKEETITGARIVIATGGRPRYPNVPGAVEYGITSDDLFSLQSPPGKTLVVGASYVALECAGFLKELGFDTTVLVRSILLRGFDQQMAEKAGEYMSNHGLKFIRPAIPTKVELLEDGQPRRLKVEYKLTETGEVKTEEFNTVLFAIGRDPDTKDLKLEKAGVHFEKSGYIPTIFEQTSVPHIYAIGDVLKGKHELTPMAIQAGKLLARRMFGGSSLHSDYINVPTTVFTPLEFGSIGLAEEDAQLIYGQQNIEVYHTLYKPLEFTVAGREDNACYGKLVCNSNDKERVLGFHVIGTNAGEITQGYAVAMKLGATKADFDSTIGIHPTSSEIFTTLSVTKSSGDDITQAGC